MMIENSYLMWVGSEHYKNVEEYSDEAIAQGVSKRLPSLAVAKALAAKSPGGATVIFIAHDEGEHVECKTCAGEVDCPECRKRHTECARISRDIRTFTDRYPDMETAPRSAQRSVEIRQRKVDALVGECDECELCLGTRRVKGIGTGGKAVLKNGETWDYRRYTYWRNANKRDIFDYEKDVESVEMCEDCGGFGTRPAGKVFGVFVPEAIEYIESEGDSPEMLEALRKDGIRVVTTAELKAEKKRKCGYRKPGGYYAASSPKADAKDAKAVAKKLSKDGLIGEATIKGAFARLVTPITIDEKRFRGIKRWALSLEAEDAAEQILEAME